MGLLGREIPHQQHSAEYAQARRNDQERQQGRDEPDIVGRRGLLHLAKSNKDGEAKQ